MRIIVVPDSFKGSLSSLQVCGIITDRLKRRGHSVVQVPVADGGEGTVEAMLLAAGGEPRTDIVQGPYGNRVCAIRGVLPGGTAVIELAQAAGLPLVGDDRRAGEATTFGVGEQLLAAVHEGSDEIVVGLGGSASNDGGCGAAAACGVRFLDADGAEFVPVGSSLHRISRVDVTGLEPALARAQITAMCDVDNPLTGPEGASYVFGPQKGADLEAIAVLDAGLAHLAEVIRGDLGVEVEHLAGAGAAGGMGAGLVAFLGAGLRSGIDVVLETAGFEDLLADADAVVTGEGSFDSQSLRGKVIHGMAARARAAGVPVHVLAGRVAEGLEPEYAHLGIRSAQAITPPGIPLTEAMARADEFLRESAEALAEQLR